MPNWCTNEFHIEVEGTRADALEIVGKLCNPNSEWGRQRLVRSNDYLQPEEFPFEPQEILEPPEGMAPASIDPGSEADRWRSQTYPETDGKPFLRSIMASIMGRDANTPPTPADIVQADCSALNIILFGSPNAYEWRTSKIGSARCWEGRAHIEEREADSVLIVARIDSAWSQVDKLLPHLLALSDKVCKARAFWIEEGNDFYGAAHADPATPNVLCIDENGCTSAYERACEALGLDAPEPEFEGEDYISIDYGTLFEWLSMQLDEMCRPRPTSRPPSP